MPRKKEDKEKKKASDHAYYLKHKVRIIERGRQWRLKNPEKAKAQRQRAYAKGKEDHKRRAAERYWRLRDQLLAESRERYKTDPKRRAVHLASAKRRRERMASDPELRERNRAVRRASDSRVRQNLDDSYVRQILLSRGWRWSEAPKEVIETMRLIVQAKREIKKCLSTI